MAKKENDDKRIGRRCLVCGLIPLALCILYYVIMFSCFYFSQTGYYESVEDEVTGEEKNNLAFPDKDLTEEEEYVPPPKIQEVPDYLGSQKGKIQVLSEKGLNVREGPNINYQVSDKIFEGDVYYYYDKDGNWYKVIGEEGNVGWVCSLYGGETLAKDLP